MSRVLIVGGAGFIGSAILTEFQKKGYELFVIDNLSFGRRSINNLPEYQFFAIDILNYRDLHRTIAAIDPHWILHLAAIHFIPYCNQHPFEASNINIQGTAHVLQAARSLPHLEKMFFASTAAVYPICNRAISEDMLPSPLDIYGLTKLAGEHLMNEFYLQTSIPTLIGRFFNAFGPNETNPHLIPEIQRQINSGQRTIQLGNLDPKRDFLHTTDMARAIRLLLEHCDQGIDTFNIGSGQEYSVLDVVKAFEANLNEPIRIEIDPARVRTIERMHLLADIAKLTAFIPWRPQISLQAGIQTLIEPELIGLHSSISSI